MPKKRLLIVYTSNRADKSTYAPGLACCVFGPNEICEVWRPFRYCVKAREGIAF